MTTVLKPETAVQVRDAVAWAVAEREPLEVVGGGSKRSFGHPAQTAYTLDVSALTGVTLYEPEELVLSAGVGTPLVEIEAVLEEQRQQLAFEPADYGFLLGAGAGAQTIGGTIACNLSGPRRIKAGAARDHFLGLKAVSGRGEPFKAGGRVVKNVTGYDMCKLLAGSHGTLAVLTEVTVKVLPAPEKTRTVLIGGLDDRAGVAALVRALASAHEVSAAAHLPAAAAATSEVAQVRGLKGAVTAVRVEGPGPSVEYRCRALRDMLASAGPIEELHSANSAAFWREVRDVKALRDARDRLIWRVSVPPAAGADVVAAVAGGADVRALYDWGGGLVWLSLPIGSGAGAEAIRAAVAGVGGHATLLRAPDDIRAAVPVFQPLGAAEAALTRRLKESFDPNGILNPGRMYAGV